MPDRGLKYHTPDGTNNATVPMTSNISRFACVRRAYDVCEGICNRKIIQK